MKSQLIFRTPKKGKKPSSIRITLQIDEAVAYIEDNEAVQSEVWNRIDDHLAAWESQMHNQKAKEPVL